MRKTITIFRVPLLITAMTAGLWAQPAPGKPLTNADLQSMAAAGLPESTILLAIQTAAYRGQADLDASPAALTVLKVAGATERVLNAVLWAEPIGAAAKQAQQREQEEQRAVPDLPQLGGVYFKSSSGWVSLSDYMFWTPFYSGANWMHGGHTYSIPLENGHAGLQIAEARPAFYLRGPSSTEGWRLIRLTTHNDQRLLRMVSSREFGQGDRIADNQLRNLQMMHVAGNIFSLRPEAGLEAGEYVLCAPVPGGPGLNVCYSFAIRR